MNKKFLHNGLRIFFWSIPIGMILLFLSVWLGGMFLLFFYMDVFIGLVGFCMATIGFLITRWTSNRFVIWLGIIILTCVVFTLFYIYEIVLII